MPETPATPSAPVWDPERFARVYREEEPRLVAHARSRSGHGRHAEDLVALAAFGVWRRLVQGPEGIDVAAELGGTLRNLTASLAPAPAPDSGAAHGPQAAQVGVLGAVLRAMPVRQATALWLVEVEGMPLTAVGRRMGSHRNAVAVLLHRARESMREAFLRAQPGTPPAVECADHWLHMPAHVRGADACVRSAELRAHTRDCADCRHRLARLVTLDGRLPALVGPALVTLFARGQAPHLAPLAGAGAASESAGAPDGERVMPLRFVRRLADRAFGTPTTLVGVALLSAVTVGGAPGGGAAGGGAPGGTWAPVRA